MSRRPIVRLFDPLAFIPPHSPSQAGQVHWPVFNSECRCLTYVRTPFPPVSVSRSLIAGIFLGPRGGISVLLMTERYDVNLHLMSVLVLLKQRGRGDHTT
jgi:hypothetical protein